jgi:diadenosine tetraphosphate (Ap4A) HIT family hydrolase
VDTLQEVSPATLEEMILLLPRWPGDTNFMTTIAETRILPEDLATTWRKLRDAFSKGD